jgi:hypothetical protein
MTVDFETTVTALDAGDASVPDRDRTPLIRRSWRDCHDTALSHDLKPTPALHRKAAQPPADPLCEAVGCQIHRLFALSNTAPPEPLLAHVPFYLEGPPFIYPLLAKRHFRRNLACRRISLSRCNKPSWSRRNALHKDHFLNRFLVHVMSAEAPNLASSHGLDCPRHLNFGPKRVNIL